MNVGSQLMDILTIRFLILGRIRNCKTGRILKLTINKDECLCSRATVDMVQWILRPVHQLVANEVVEKPSSYSTVFVDHIDRDRLK
jgi:hypothetical protein